jgi:hypothetical protein
MNDEIKEFMRQLHESFKNNGEISDKEATQLSMLIYNRDAKGSFDPEVAAVQRGVFMGMCLYRQIIKGNEA